MLAKNSGKCKPASEAAFRRQLEAVENGVRIEEVVGEYGSFKPTGTSRLIGRCLNPSHEDRTPSMTVYTDRQKFRCYSCGVHGDSIDLEMLVNPGMEIQEALVSLRLRYGIELPTRPALWFRRQERQAPIREVIDRERIRHIRMLVYRLIWVPWLKRLPEWMQDEAEESAWRDSLRVAELLYAERGSA
jgi:CHC2 zinc finger